MQPTDQQTAIVITGGASGMGEATVGASSPRARAW